MLKGEVAMASGVPAKELSQEATCFVCLVYFDDLVVLKGCGHLFCKACLSRYSGECSAKATCPQCTGRIQPSNSNWQLSDINIVKLEEPEETDGMVVCKEEEIPVPVGYDRPIEFPNPGEFPTDETSQELQETMMSKKRKIDSEGRTFKHQWTNDYFFIRQEEKAVCLICQKAVSVFKVYNLRRHYQIYHKDKYDCLVGEARRDTISKLENILATQQNTFVMPKNENITSLQASFQVAKLIACTGRPFAEGQLVKEGFLLSVAKEMCPEKAELFTTVSLSARTITRRIEEMGKNLRQHLQNSANFFSYFSLALAESSDVRDSAQLLIFIRGINYYFEVTEELAALQTIKGTTTGEDIYEKICQTVNGLELDWAKLVSVATDGAPRIVGSKKGAIACTNQEMDKFNHSPPIAIHCLIHPQALCSKLLTWDSVMKTVVSCVNFIRANALNHRQFQEFLSELNVACEDAQYHTEIRWLSQGTVLKRFYELLPQITAFLLSKNKKVPELSDAEWKWHFAFLTDVTELLNSFSVQLQGKGKLISDMQSHVKEFEAKLGLLIKQVKEENFCQLPTTQKLLEEKPMVAFPSETCVDSLEKLQKEFQLRFKELHLYEQDIQLFCNPFSVDIENVDSIYQMELSDLHSCDSLKEAFKSSSLLNFYAFLPSDTYPNLRNHALKMASIFGSTYVCEKAFSRMKHLKSPTRSRLTDAHLQHLLRLSVTNMEPDIDHIISQKQAQSSH